MPLWCKSNFSFLEGASHPEELVRVRELAIPALVLADRDGVYGVVRAHVAAGGRSSRAPRLIVGAQLTVVDFPEQAATGAGGGSGGAEAVACRRPERITPLLICTTTYGCVAKRGREPGLRRPSKRLCSDAA